jgi:DNA-directed RNA polymerase subunit RPC12/RpoP
MLYSLQNRFCKDDVVSMNKQPPEIRPVTCSHCQQKQFVKVEPTFSIRFMYGQSVECVSCKSRFDVTLPYQIIDGPNEQG